MYEDMPKATNQKDLIVRTALRLFAKNGYASTPVSLIAKTAHVSQGLMYNFFSSKEDLLKEMMAIGFRDIQLSMTSYQQLKDPNEAIAVHIRKTIAIVKQNKEIWKLLHTLRLQEKVAVAMRKQFHQVVTGVTATFQSVFKKLGYAQADLEAVLFLTQVDGLVILYLQDNTIPLDQLGEQLIKRYVS
jgi:AcrR family transcriptional regulator